MSGQGIKQASGEEAFDGWIGSVIGIISGAVEIHLSEVSMRKYGNNIPKGTMIFTLPDNTITGHISGVLDYMIKTIHESKKTGMDLVDHLINEIKKLDLEVSEDVE